jgi:hypothetical protein
MVVSHAAAGRRPVDTSRSFLEVAGAGKRQFTIRKPVEEMGRKATGLNPGVSGT